MLKRAIQTKDKTLAKLTKRLLAEKQKKQTSLEQAYKLQMQEIRKGYVN